MDIDLAAFRLNALATLTASDGGRRQGNTGGTDFLDVLTSARSAMLPGTAAGAGRAPGSAPSPMDVVLSRLEASNSAFLRSYNARVAAIGDESQVLTQLRARMAELGAASKGLESLGPANGNGEIKAALSDFIARYNEWDAEFDPYFEQGALLDDNQAGEVARFSLRREVGSIFHGAGNGGFAQGLADMGVRLTPDGQLVLDAAALDVALESNRNGAVQTLNNMARAFGQTAEVLASDGHLLDRRIDNGARALAWASANQDDVEAEFGPRIIV